MNLDQGYQPKAQGWDVAHGTPSCGWFIIPISNLQRGLFYGMENHKLPGPHNLVSCYLFNFVVLINLNLLSSEFIIW
jgi:hypothetical protein